MSQPAARRFRRSAFAVTAGVVWVPLLLVLAVAVALTATTDVTVRQLTQDPTTVLGGPFFIGAISNLGNVLWAASATVALLPALALGRTVAAEWRRFLGVSAAFTAILLIDDMLLVHDEILPEYAGISGEVYGLLYVAAMAAYLVAFRASIMRTNFYLLVIALVLFGVSTVVDLASSRIGEAVPSSIVILVEDAAKLLGIGTWLAYFVSVARQVIGTGAAGTPGASLAPAVERTRARR